MYVGMPRDFKNDRRRGGLLAYRPVVVTQRDAALIREEYLGLAPVDVFGLGKARQNLLFLDIRGGRCFAAAVFLAFS